MSEILVDGLLIDQDSGEVLGDIPGGDAAALAATRLADCKAQVKAYEQAIALYQQVLFRYQDGKTATYGDLKVSIRQSTRKDQDVEAMREFIGGMEFTREEYRGFALAAKGFDLSRIESEPLRDALADFVTESLTRPFCVVETVRKPAPRMEMQIPREALGAVS